VARSSLAWIITELRRMVNDSGSDVWTDDELQKMLDRNRVIIRRELLMEDVDELQFYSRFGNLEGTYAYSTEDGATWDDDATIIKLWDSDSADATAITPDGWNLVDGLFTFTSEQNDSCYLDGISYNLHGAIAEAMEQLAMDRDRASQWARGGVSYTHYDLMELSKYHRSLAGPRGATVVRTYRTPS